MKYLLSVPIILFPYELLFGIYCIATGFLMEEVFDNNGFILIGLMILAGIIALMMSIIVCATSLLTKSSSKSIARLNMTIKLAQIPAYIAIFVFGVVCVLSIVLVGFAIFLFFFDLFVIALTGLIGSVGVKKTYDENKLDKKMSLKYALLQYVFCIDVLTSIKLYKTTKQTNNLLKV